MVDTNFSDQVETPSADTTAAGSEETEVQESEEQTEEQVGEKKDGRDRRISKLAYKNRELGRQVNKLTELVKQSQVSGGTKPAETDAKVPVRDDFETDDAYTDAIVQHKVSVAVEKATKEIKSQNQAVQANRAATESQALFQNKVNAGFDKYGERFEEAVEDITYTQQMVKHIGHSNNFAEIAMHLLDNPGEALKMENMSEPELVRAIVTLEHKIAPAGTDTSKKRTKAPDTPTSVKSSKTHSGKVDYSKMTGDEYKRMKDKERVQAAKR